jgi:hypothetical protein
MELTRCVIPVSTRSVLPARDAFAWLGSTLVLWRQAPGCPDAGLPAADPGRGGVAGDSRRRDSRIKFAVTVASGWALLMVDGKARQDAMAPMRQWRQLRPRLAPLTAVAALGLGVFAFQIGVCAWLAGRSQALMLVTGQTQGLAILPGTLGLVFASSLIPGVPLMLVLSLPCSGIAHAPAPSVGGCAWCAATGRRRSSSPACRRCWSG